MKDDLYFIPILLDALSGPDRAARIRRAFDIIVAQGSEPRYKRGYAQFLGFMNAVDAFRRRDEARQRIPMSGSESDMHAMCDDQDEIWDLLELLADLPELEGMMDTIKAELMVTPPPPLAIELVLVKDGEPLRRCEMSGAVPVAVLPGILPGVYRLSSAAGRVIWEAELCETDLLLACAFPSRPLKAAAATDDVSETPSRDVPLLGGTLLVRVFPGRDTGRLEIRLCTP